MAANVYTIFEYAANKNWGGIDALDSRTRRAKGVAVQRRLLRDACTLRDANGEVIPFEGNKGELVEGKLVEEESGEKIWAPDRRKVLRNDMKHADSLTGAGGGGLPRFHAFHRPARRRAGVRGPGRRFPRTRSRQSRGPR